MRLIDLCEYTMNKSLNQELGLDETNGLLYLRRFYGTWEFQERKWIKKK